MKQEFETYLFNLMLKDYNGNIKLIKKDLSRLFGYDKNNLYRIMNKIKAVSKTKNKRKKEEEKIINEILNQI